VLHHRSRISFGNALKAKLLDPAAVGLLNRNDVVVEVHLLANVLERTLTIANSLAPKKPFSRTRKTTANSLRRIMPGASQLIAGAPTASALLARKGKMFISHGSALDRASRVPIRPSAR
jgi:hypothetical protein